MMYFKIIAQDEHVFWLSDTIKLEKALIVRRAADDSAVIYLHNTGKMFTYLAEYSTEAHANAVLAELKDAYQLWNPNFAGDNSPTEILKKITAADSYVLPQENSEVSEHDEV